LGSFRNNDVEDRDRALIQIMDSAWSESARKSGDWLVCHPGCSQCCYGPFPINALDAHRLLQGLETLTSTDPERAAQLRHRARAAVEKLSPDFPGHVPTGILFETEEAEAQFADFANDEPCPALDPATGTCDLYASRPMTCRTFGPPMRCGSEAVAVCELCYHGASDDQIAACEVTVDLDSIELPLVAELERERGFTGNTIVAFCLAG
jgi:Fe-S-cluster containining protein